MPKLLFVAFIALSSISVFAQDAPGDAKMKEMMAAWQKYSTPSAAHKLLAPMAGKWSYTSKAWMSEGAKPEESSGTSTIKMILGGRFLQHDIKGKAMGMPFEGLGLTGYNNLTEKYETFWADNMGTGMMHGSGSFDSVSNTLKDSGEFTCPMEADKKAEYRSEWKIIDKNNMIYTMWAPDMNTKKEFKNMEMVFKRKK
ncbi:MAG: DUF1579 domain-containing protein [Bacteriovoracia bacterium]